jgi:hypothetical protein
MNIRPVLAALAVAGGLLVAGAAPAFASGPPVPPGCTFDQSDGVLTCVSTTTNATSVGPLSTSGAVTPPATVDGLTVQQICVAVFGTSFGTFTDTALTNITFDVTVTATTTTERHGLNGKIFDTSTSASSAITGYQYQAGGSAACGLPQNPAG